MGRLCLPSELLPFRVSYVCYVIVDVFILASTYNISLHVVSRCVLLNLTTIHYKCH